jgi:CheY-like chemotaxis protein
MPGMDGIELQEKLKDIDPALPVVIMTGYASVDTAVQALKNGAYDYITKPFDPGRAVAPGCQGARAPPPFGARWPPPREPEEIFPAQN